MNNATIEFRTRRACSTRIAWSIAVILVAAAAGGGPVLRDYLRRAAR